MIAASQVLDRVLVLEMVRVTEAAAVAASALIGRGDEKAADAAAVEMPIVTAVDALLKGQASVEAVLEALMARPPRAEAH